MKKFLIIPLAALVSLAGSLAAQAEPAGPSLSEASVTTLKKVRASEPAPKIEKAAALKIDLGDILFPDRGRGDRRQGPGRGGNDRWRGPGRDGRRPGRQEISCNASDRGWEEHWGGHRSRGFNLPQLERAACEDCFRKHGKCTVRCVTEEFRCTAKFKAGDGSFDSEIYGDSLPRRFDAEDSALDRCWRVNRGRAGTCELTGRCDDVGRTLSSGRCRK